jgi:NAD-dependent DNA ligase
VGIAERDYMRRNDEPPRIRWEFALMIAVGAILLIAFAVQHCSSTAGKNRHLGKGSLILNINKATAEELQTLPDVGPTRAARIIQNRPYESVDGLFEKRALPKAIVEANRSLLKTSGENERTARHH